MHRASAGNAADSYMRLPKPDTLHGNQDILQCYEALICGYLAAHGFPYYGLFSDSWGFYYQAPDRFGAYEPACTYPLWRNLNRLYGVKKRLFHDVDLHELTVWMRTSGQPLFLIADQYDLPWVTEYGMIHHHHYLLVSGASDNGTMLRIQDLWPNEYRAWYPFDSLEAAYRARGKLAFQLSPPDRQPDASAIRDQLAGCVAIMEGEVNGIYRSGIHGLKEMRRDIERSKGEFVAQAEHKFDMLRRVVDARWLFAEFLCHLKRSAEWEAHLPASLLQSVEHTIKCWLSLRNYLVLSSLKHDYRYDRCMALVERIIDGEQTCIRDLKALLSQRR